MDIGPSEAETFWTDFLRKLRRRGLRGVKLVISDAHEGIKAAVSKVLTSSWQRCRVGGASSRPSSPPLSPRTTPRPPAANGARWRTSCGQRRPSSPTWRSRRRIGPAALDQSDGEIKRRTEVVGIFPNEGAIVRLIGAILLEQNDEWAVQRSRYMTLETIASLSDDGTVSLPALAV